MKIIIYFAVLLLFGCSSPPKSSPKPSIKPMSMYGHTVRRSKTVKHPLPKFKD